jgi:hypothetical protein
MESSASRFFLLEKISNFPSNSSPNFTHYNSERSPASRLSNGYPERNTQSKPHGHTFANPATPSDAQTATDAATVIEAVTNDQYMALSDRRNQCNPWFRQTKGSFSSSTFDD